MADDASVARPVSPNLKRKCETPEQALGAVITDLRTKRGWGYVYVSGKVGCDPSYLNGIEHGKHNPSLKLLLAIADLHGVKLSQLMAAAERKHLKARK